MLRARLVWNDLRLAIDLLERETDPNRFRVFLAASLALVRSVGSVLHKIDEETTTLGPAIKSAYGQWKQDRKQHQIFWEFIKSERDRVLKEYEWNFDPQPVVVVLAGKTKKPVDVSTLSDNIYCPIAEGPFAGEDIRDVLADAVEWWDTQLKLIENSP